MSKFLKGTLSIAAIGLLGGLLLLSMAGCGSSNNSSNANSTSGTKQPYTIGLVADLTGPLASLGVDTAAGMQVETKYYNSLGGVNGHQIKLIILDDGSNAGQANADFVKLMVQDKCSIVLGPTSGAFDALAQSLALRYKVPLIGFTPDEAAGAAQNKYSFCETAGGVAVGQAVAKICQLDGYKAVVGMSDVEPTFITALQTAAKTAKAMGINFVPISGTVTPGQIDMSTVALQLKNEAAKIHANALFIGTIGTDGVTMIKALRTIGCNLPVIGTHAWGATSTIQAGGSVVNGAEFPEDSPIVAAQLPNSDPVKAPLLAFAKRYQAEIGRPFTGFSAHAYTMVRLAAAALKAVGPNSDAIVNWLNHDVHNFVGSEGLISYTPQNHLGLGQTSLWDVKIINGQFKIFRYVTL